MRQFASFRRLALASTALCLAGAAASPGEAATCVWTGGVGDWTNAAFWSCGTVPGSGDAVVIDLQPNVASTVNLTGGQNAGTVALDSGDTIAISNGSLNIYGGTVANNGLITLGYYGYLVGQSASTTISGTGSILLDSSAGPADLYGAGANQLTIGSGQTVLGRGSVGIDQGAITNNGTINANSTTGALYLDARGGSGGNTDGTGLGSLGAGFVNNGLLTATGGGNLVFYGGLYDNRAGTISAVGAGSVVTFADDSSIVGGTLSSSGGGVISENGNGTQYLTDVMLSGGSSLNIANDVVRLGNTFTNNGTVRLTYYGQLAGNSAVTTIAGNGSIILDNGDGPAMLYGLGANTLVIGGGQVVQGRGQIGIDQGAITNNGTISANYSGSTLSIDARGGSGGLGDGSGVGPGNAFGFLNNNVLQATGGGTLVLLGGTYLNGANGIVRAVGTGSVVTLGDDASITGGVLSSSGGGVISESGNGTQYITNVTLAGGSTFNISNDTVRIGTAFTNNGTVNLSYYGYLVGNSAANTIGGTGTITLDSSGGPARLYGLGANTLTIGSGQTIVGRGEVGIDQGAITNNGVINANAGTGVLYLDARGGSGGNTDGTGLGSLNAGFVNTNLLTASGGGTLWFASGLYDNRAGTISATGTGSSVVLGDDSSIVGGLLSTGAGAAITENANGTQYITDVTLAGGSTFNIVNDTVRIGNGFTNNGTINLSYYGYLVGNSATNTIGGNGSITLDSTNGPARLYGLGADKLTIGSGQVVSGSGEVGLDQGAITNAGIINANMAGRTLYLDARGGSGGNTDGTGLGTYGAGLVNTNLLEATGGGTLYFVGGLYDNSGGTISATGTNSVVTFGDDASIVGGVLTSSGGGVFSESANGTQYLTNTTLTSGSTFAISNDKVRLGGTFTNNGAVTVSYYGSLIGNSPATTINGTGTITLDNTSGPARLYGLNANLLTIGSGQTVNGSGEVGIDQGAIINGGTITATGAITLDARGGGGGNTDLSGVGTGNLAGFYNAPGGVLGAGSGATLTLASGLYEQAAGATFSVGNGGLFTMVDDANLVNLRSGGVLDLGRYAALAGGTMTLRSGAASTIATIGADRAGTDTVVSLSGAGSTLNAQARNGGVAASIDSTLQSIARSGELMLAAGRAFVVQTGAFTNAGILALSGGASFAAPAGFANSGLVTGNGTVASPVTNTGSVVADGGTLFAQAITGSTGTIQSNPGATLNLAAAAGPSTAGYLVNGGTLALGANNVTVTSDYQNANFGSGNAFNRHADVSGSGLILAASATMDLSGPGLTGNSLNVGNVRLGGTSSTTLTITNNGTLTTLRGAVQSPMTNTVSISSSNFVVGPNGGSTTVNLSYQGTQAGSLSGQTLTVANNFDNVADRMLTITGAAYNPAAASLSPNPITLGAVRVGGTLQGSVTIANTAPAGGYSESLAVTGTSGSGGANGTAPGGLIAAGSSASSTVRLDTGTSGIKSGSVTYQLATDGTGTSGLAQLALPSQSVAVNGKVYQMAQAQLAASSVTFATVRQGSAAPTAGVTVTNTATGALTDSLNTSIASLPNGITGTAPGALAGGQSGPLTFTESTAAAGVFGGTGQIGFTSTDPDLAPLTLASQSVSFAGTVTQAAVAQIVKDSGAGTFAGGGSLYTLDLGTITGGTGVLSTDLGVNNAIPNFAYDETLGGAFTASGGTGYTFAGITFSGLTGGSTDTGNLLTFNYGGLSDGTYTDVLTFSGYSRYAGLSDLTLTPITVNVTARVSGNIVPPPPPPPPPAVPEPASWALMILGFGAVGTAMRRRRGWAGAVPA